MTASIAAGVLSLDFQADQFGSAQIEVRATDGEDEFAADTFEVTVASVNDKPASIEGAASTPEDTAVDIDLKLLAQDVETADEDLAFAIVTDAPAAEGSTLLNGSVVTFTPGLNFSGQATFTFRTTDGDGASSDAQNVVVTVSPVNDAPVLDAIGSQTIVESTTLSFTAVADDVDGDTLTFSLADGTNVVPNGAGISADGLFSWTPTQAQGPGVYKFKVVVTDSADPALSHEEEIEVTVAEENITPVLTSPGDQSVYDGEELSFSLEATDPDTANGQTLTFSATGPGGAALPAGITLDAEGNFSWTPTASQVGTYAITFTVSDGNSGGTDSVTITIEVMKSNTAPVLPFVGARTVFFGRTTNLNFAATDADLPKNILSYSLIGAPMGASINPATGLFTWTPTASQSLNKFYSFAIRVQDNGAPSKSDQKTASCTVQYPAELSVNPTFPSLKADGLSKKVTLVYTVRNNTNVAYTNLKVGGGVAWPSSLQSVVLTPAPGTSATQSTLNSNSRLVAWTIPTLPAFATITISVQLTGVVPANAARQSKIATGFALSPVTGNVIPVFTAPDVVLNTFR